MDNDKWLEKMKSAVIAGEIEQGESIAADALQDGLDPLLAIEEGYVSGIEEIGRLFAEGEIFLPQLIAGAEVMKKALAVLEPALIASKRTREITGRVIIGSVANDIHDIGKDIVASMLTASGFQVTNLGVDVSVEMFIAKAREMEPHIIGLSALLTTTMPEQRKVITQLNEEGLRHKVKVMVGGAPVDKQWADSIGADGFAENAIEAVSLAKTLVKKG